MALEKLKVKLTGRELEAPSSGETKLTVFGVDATAMPQSMRKAKATLNNSTELTRTIPPTHCGTGARFIII